MVLVLFYDYFLLLLGQGAFYELVLHTSCNTKSNSRIRAELGVSKSTPTGLDEGGGL